MKKFMIIALLLGFSASTLAAEILSPGKGIVCDKKASFCVDSQGISMVLTEKYLGTKAQERLTKVIGGNSRKVNLWDYTLSNGVHCDSHEKRCYTDRYFPRTREKLEPKLTEQIFGNTH
ncbi:TPA: YcgJ family protein [Yersinia enterocolitica]